MSCEGKFIRIVDVHGNEVWVHIAQIRSVYKPPDSFMRHWEADGGDLAKTRAMVDYGSMPIDTLYTPWDAGEIAAEIERICGR